jgi:hypothetical protein
MASQPPDKCQHKYPYEVVCPNCGDIVPGLVSGVHGVTHCGCYYEGRGEYQADTDDFWKVYEYDTYHGVRLKDT